MGMIHANISLKIRGLSSSEHSVLNALAVRTNDNNESHASAQSLALNTSFARGTVYLALESLSEKGLIFKTGRMVGKTKSIPVYKLNFGLSENSSNVIQFIRR